MSVLATVLIVIAEAVVGFAIGFAATSKKVALKPKEDVHTPIIVSKVVMPKRIKEIAYNERVNSALKEAIDKTVDVWIFGDDKHYKRQLANLLYAEWHPKIENVSYRDFNPDLPCLYFVGRRAGSGFVFEAFWCEKVPKNPNAAAVGYARRHR